MYRIRGVEVRAGSDKQYILYGLVQSMGTYGSGASALPHKEKFKVALEEVWAPSWFSST